MAAVLARRRAGSTITLLHRRALHVSYKKLQNGSKLPPHPAAIEDTGSFDKMTAPTWSVHELLSTYPAPKLAPELLTKLHKLSALTPPAEDSDAFRTLKHEMEELVRLVEAVKLVGTGGIDSDGRILPRGRGIDLGQAQNYDGEVAEQTDILKHATKTVNGLYIVDTPPSGRRK